MTNLIGHDTHEWPLVVIKELVDNALDAAEEAGVAPCIEIGVSTADRSISVTDNGPGFPAKTITSILDFSARTSSKEAYCSPTRGQQGHALSTILAMPFALAQGDEAPGQIIIQARGVRHEVSLQYDPIRRVPIPKHECSRSFVKAGTRFAVQWPVSGTSKLADAKARFLQIADAYTWMNPHLGLTLSWDGVKEIAVNAYKADWKKWLPSDPTSAHWYDYARFERRIAATQGLAVLTGNSSDFRPGHGPENTRRTGASGGPSTAHATAWIQHLLRYGPRAEVRITFESG